MANQMVSDFELAKLNLTVGDDASTSIGLILSHANTTLWLTSDGSVTITVPHSSTVDFPTGTTIRVMQGGDATAVNFVAAENVQLRSKSGYVKMAGAWAVVMLVKFQPNEWLLYGDLIASS